jgi:glutaredoxin
MARWLLLLLAMGAAWGWQQQAELRHWWRHDVMGVPAPPGVQVYTVEGCTPCEEAARLIEGAGVPVTRRAVDRDADARDELDAAGGRLPLIVDGRRRMQVYSEEILRDWYVRRGANRALLHRAGVYRDGEPRIPVLYGTDWCGYCAAARAWFTARGMAFRDLDIERDPDARRQYDTIGLSGVPVVVYEDMIWNGFSDESMDVRRQWVEAL